MANVWARPQRVDRFRPRGASPGVEGRASRPPIDSSQLGVVSVNYSRNTWPLETEGFGRDRVQVRVVEWEGKRSGRLSAS